MREISCGPTELTVSIGIAAVSEKTETWEGLLSHADEAMYEAKHTGKNRAVIHRENLSQLSTKLGQRTHAP